MTWTLQNTDAIAPRCFAAVAVSLLLSLSSVAAAQSLADPIVGLWRTFDDKTGQPQGLIRISKRGNEYIGSIERNPDEPDSGERCTACRDARHDQPIVGLVILEGLRRQQDNAYLHGRILDPDTGNTWQCDVHVSSDGRSLDIHGFVGLRVLGRSQTWKRVTGPS